ncbi:MAG: hypothetical protein ABSH48_08700 [Verrucomicrobiota bacterium]|jgi:hypothetical protein
MKNTTTMNLENPLRQMNRGVNPGAKIKKVALKIEVGKSNLALEIKRLFDLAKSSGQELDLTFSQNKMGTL